MGREVIHHRTMKKFLNNVIGENGAVCFDVEAIRYTSSTDAESFVPYSVNAELRIQDCARPIHLEFGFGDSAESNDENEIGLTFEDRLDKLDVMIDSLVDMRNHMKVAYGRIVAENAKIREAKASSTKNEKEVSEDGR